MTDSVQVYFGLGSNGNYAFFHSDVGNVPNGAILSDQATCDAMQAAVIGQGMLGADTNGKPIVVPYTADQQARIQTLSARLQLQALDAYLPRALEDMWSASGFDTTKLPAIQQQRLQQKQKLRSQI